MKRQDNQKRLAVSLRGGGCPAGAYIGLLQLLQEEGIKIDYILGSSGGGYIALLYAFGYNVEEITDQITQQEFKNYFGWDSIRDQALISDEKTIAFINRSTKGRTFVETEIPLFLQATNITTGESEILSEGDVASASYAAAAVPVLTKPFEFNGVTYIDGDLSSGYAASFLRAQGAEVVIGVNNMDDYADLPAYKDGIAARFERSVSISSRNIRIQDQQLDPVDILISGMSEMTVGFLDCKHAFELVDYGYNIAKKHLDHIKSLLF